MSSTPKHSVSVAGVVINDNQQVLLIQRRDNGHWEPPGGVLELAETFEEGVCREVREETGITIEVDRLSGVYKNIRRGVVALVFRCHAIGGKAKPTEESSNVAWFDQAEAVGLMDQAYAVRVMDAFHDTAIVRAHDGVRLVNVGHA